MRTLAIVGASAHRPLLLNARLAQKFTVPARPSRNLRGMAQCARRSHGADAPHTTIRRMKTPPPYASMPVEVLIEVPRGSFVKRDGRGVFEFISPLPCPFNYGSLPGLPAADGDAQDAVLLGPRVAAGQRVQVPVRAVICFVDAGQQDDKLICAHHALGVDEQRVVLGFFRFYALCKRMLNLARGRPGATRCLGWGAVDSRFAQASCA